jgi:hypothetical protein
MIYVFDDNEELQACCGCPVTPDGQRTLSIINDLSNNFGVHNGNLNAGVIEVVSALPNFALGNPPPGPAPAATNGVCSPIGSQDRFGRVRPVAPLDGLRSWITHNESLEPGNIAQGKTVHSLSVDELQNAPLHDTDLLGLEALCAFTTQNGSGQGVCACGAGENSVVGGSTRTPQ